MRMFVALRYMCTMFYMQGKWYLVKLTGGDIYQMVILHFDHTHTHTYIHGGLVRAGNASFIYSNQRRGIRNEEQ